MAARQDTNVKRRSSLRRFDIFRPHVPQSIASVARTSSTRSTSFSTSSSSPLSDTFHEAGLFPSVFRKPTIRKMPKSNALTINLTAAERNGVQPGLTSPRTPLSPRTPQSPAQGELLGAPSQYAEGYDVHVRSPINALPPPPSSKHKTSKIFQNYKASKSSTKVNKPESPRLGTSITSDSQVYLNRTAGKSSPDVSNLHSDHPSPKSEHQPELQDERKDSTTAKEKDRRRDKHKFGHILSRKASLKADDELPPRTADKSSTLGRLDQPLKTIKDRQMMDMPMRTAPLEKERGFRSAMNSALRNRSLDRQTNPDSEEENAPPRMYPSQPSKPSTLGSNGTPVNSSFISNIRSSGSRAAEGVNRARKGLFGKLHRSASSHERELAPKEPYELRVINLPLVQQTRMTRISKRLEKSKDKTEFWMPALPWRCIDYLNLNGTTSEGLYRVPGSDRDIRHWQMRFDKELDINLFDQEDLYDVNTVSSMFKAWLRGLPELVFPQDIQTKIMEKCSKVEPAPETTPQYLKDELSKLPPWNYYLLFAITCHISLLHNCSKDNKMTYQNLCVCFAPCLKIEQWIFQWLILDWKNCWQGCSSEREYLEKEYALLDEQERELSGETASVSTNRTKVSNLAPSTVRTVPTSAARSTAARGPDGGGSYVPGRERPIQHFDKHPPPPVGPQTQSQSQQRPSTSHGSLAAEQRNISSKDSSKPSLLGDESLNGRSSPDRDAMQFFPQPVQPTNSTENSALSSEKKSRKDDRSPNRPVTSHIASQHRSKERSREQSRERNGSNAVKKEKHRPPPMQSMDSPERSSSSERNGNDWSQGRVGLTAPELSPLKPLSPMMYE